MKAGVAAARGYIASDDPRVAVTNLVAMVLTWNTPFYPFYLLATAGSSLHGGVWLTLGVFPVFLAVPAVARRSSFWGRVLLVAAGTVNTVFCTWVLGEASGTALFLLPCISLAALVFRRSERAALLTLLALPGLAFAVLSGRYPASPFTCAGAACDAIAWMNVVSVAILTAFLGYLATGLAAGGVIAAACVGAKPNRP